MTASHQLGHREVATAAADGCALINYRFTTSASHNPPTPYLHLRWAWVEVRGEGCSGVVVPVRHESQPTAEVLRESKLMVPIGLLPVRS